MLGIPRTGTDLGVDRERAVPLWLGVVVGEVVDELLDADGVLGRQAALIEEPPGVGVRRRVHVDREGRERVAPRVEEPLLVDARVALGAHRTAVAPAGVLTHRHACRPRQDGQRWRRRGGETADDAPDCTPGDASLDTPRNAEIGLLARLGGGEGHALLLGPGFVFRTRRYGWGQLRARGTPHKTQQEHDPGDTSTLLAHHDLLTSLQRAFPGPACFSLGPCHGEKGSRRGPVSDPSGHEGRACRGMPGPCPRCTRAGTGVDALRWKFDRGLEAGSAGLLRSRDGRRRPSCEV